MGQQIAMFEDACPDASALPAEPKAKALRRAEDPPATERRPASSAAAAEEAPEVSAYYRDLLERASAEVAPTMRALGERPRAKAANDAAKAPPLAFSVDCGFCGAHKGEACVWSVRQWPDAWVHSARIAGLPRERRLDAERDAWIDVLLELLEAGPVPVPGQQSELWQQHMSLDTNRGGYRLALEELKRRGVIEGDSKRVWRVRR